MTDVVLPDLYIYNYGNSCDYACAEERCSQNRSHLAYQYLNSSSSLWKVLDGIANATTNQYWWTGLKGIDIGELQWFDGKKLENISQIQNANETGNNCTALQILPGYNNCTLTALNCSYSNGNLHILCEKYISEINTTSSTASTSSCFTTTTEFYVTITLSILFLCFLVFMIVICTKRQKKSERTEAATTNAAENNPENNFDDYDDTLYENENYTEYGSRYNDGIYEEPIRSRASYVNVSNGPEANPDASGTHTANMESGYQNIAHPYYDNIYEPVESSLDDFRR